MAHTDTEPLPQLLTLDQFASRHPAFPVSTLRWLRYRSSGPDPNGFADGFVRAAGRILVDEQKFFRVIEQQNAASR